MQEQGRRKPDTTMLQALIYSPSSRLGLIITNDNHKRGMNIMSRISWRDLTKECRTYKRSEDILYTNTYMTY